MTALIPGTKIGDYVFEKTLGSGSFATVWKAHHTTTNIDVAIKVIQKSTITSSVAKTRFLREIALLKQFDHPFIAQFFEVIEDKNFFYLVMEHVQNGNLLEYVNTNGRLSEETARRYFEELICVLEYLHTEKKVAHRDLKCENVLLDRYYNIRVIDFGLANMFSEAAPKLNTACGSPAYAAPEVVRGEPYTIAADIWSAGILLYAVTVGHLPFDDDNVTRLLQKVVYSEPDYPAFLSPPLVDLLSKLICKDPAERITINKLKEHTWFSMAEYTSIKQHLNPESGKQNTHSGQPGETGSGGFTIDHETIEQMTALNIDTHLLHESLLIGEFTELTAVYRILAREKLVNYMKELMRKVAQSTGGAPLHQSHRIFTMPPARVNQQPGKTQERTPMPRFLAPNTPKAYGPLPGMTPRLLAPGATGVAGRRLSRPVAVRRPVVMPVQDQMQSLETP